MVYLWIGAAAAFLGGVVSECVSSGRRGPSRTDDRSTQQPRKPRDKEDKDSEPDDEVANLLVFFSKEREILEKTIPDSIRNNLVIELDIMEAFIVTASKEIPVEVLKALITVIVAVNCAKGLNDRFPKNMVPFVLEESFDILSSEVKKASLTYEFIKVALRSIEELKEILRAHI